MPERSKKKKKVPGEAEPVERYETIRKYLAALLEEGSYTAKDLSGIIKIPEKDICDHLAHLQHSLEKTGRRLVVLSASCHHCGFVFKKRERLTKPGKCPTCRSIHIRSPIFHIGNR
ncbi:MAG: transcriptional regulator [Syntrophorhabdus sp.]